MEAEVDMGGCAAMGVAGYHSDHYADPDDGICQWCGERAPVLEEPPDEDPDLTALRALNARIEALQLSRGDGPDPALDEAIDALEHEAAGLIRARCEKDLEAGERALRGGQGPRPSPARSRSPNTLTSPEVALANQALLAGFSGFSYRRGSVAIP